MIEILLFQTFEEGYAYITSSIALDHIVREKEWPTKQDKRGRARRRDSRNHGPHLPIHSCPYPGSKMSKSMFALPQINNFFEKTVVRSLLGIIKMRLPCLSEASSAAAHDLALADELGVEFGSVEREVNVKVDAVESTLRGIHAFEVLFEVLP